MQSSTMRVYGYRWVVLLVFAVINAVVQMRWFPVHERATAVGIATLAQFIGIIAVMVVTPLLVAGGGGQGERIPSMSPG